MSFFIRRYQVGAHTWLAPGNRLWTKTKMARIVFIYLLLFSLPGVLHRHSSERKTGFRLGFRFKACVYSRGFDVTNILLLLPPIPIMFPSIVVSIVFMYICMCVTSVLRAYGPGFRAGELGAWTDELLRGALALGMGRILFWLCSFFAHRYLGLGSYELFSWPG